MQAVQWLAISLTLALTGAEADNLMPGVRLLQSRPKRQGASIIFPDSSFVPSPLFPNEGLGRFAPRPPPPSVVVRPGNADATPVGGTDGSLELPEDLDLNALDRGSLSRVNSISNISDFAELFGIQLPFTEEAEGHLRIGPRTGNTIGAAEMATMATCKPELQTVELDLPVESNTLYYPTCVRLEQCGGCCYGPLLACRPKVTKVVRLKVLKTVISRSTNTDSSRSRPDSRRQSRRRRRRRRQAIPTYHEVEAIKHVQCECGCKVKEQDCNPTIHNYLESDCACVCKSRDEKAKCEQKDNTKYWDNDSCACYCRRVVECGSGEYFSHTSCKCERLVARGGFAVDDVEDGIERWRPFERPHRGRPVRIPLRSDQPASSRRPTLLTMIHTPRHDVIS